MNHPFDELITSLTLSVTRRAALKEFGVGLAGLALVCFGLTNKAQAQTSSLPNLYVCTKNSDCWSGHCISRGGKHSGYPETNDKYCAP